VAGIRDEFSSGSRVDRARERGDLTAFEDEFLREAMARAREL
jgi:hypothetical protein